MVSDSEVALGLGSAVVLGFFFALISPLVLLIAGGIIVALILGAAE